TAIWTVGSATSALRIESGGSLRGDHAILLTGTFEVQNGGTYIHNNTASVSTSTGASIFGGTTTLGSSSTFEIRNWPGNTTGLPASFNWGNLTINLTGSLGGAWDWGVSSSLNIAGDLNIQSTGGQELWMSTSGTVNIAIGGNYSESGTSIVVMKAGSSLSGNTVVQVTGNVALTGTATLNVGNSSAGASAGNYDFRFLGNFAADVTNTITSGSSNAYLVAFNSGNQFFSSAATIGCNFRIISGSTVTLLQNFVNTSGSRMAILGILSAGASTITSNGTVDIAGGTLNSSGGGVTVNGADCNVCTGNGTFGGFAGWCQAAGNVGKLNLTNGTLNFSTPGNTFRVGHSSPISKGEAYLLTSARINFAGPGSSGFLLLNPTSILSFDETSYAEGNANYNGQGGTLIIGDNQGIVLNPATLLGNIRVTVSRNYDNSGINSFTYQSSQGQLTGTGLPSTVDGILRFDNQHANGITFSGPVTVASSGALELVNGVVKTNSTNFIALADNVPVTGGSSASYVEGPFTKIGDETFTFHIGKLGRYAPVTLTSVSGQATTDSYTAEYFYTNPGVLFGTSVGPGIDHISSKEYWLISRTSGIGLKKVTLPVSAHSGASDISKLVVARHNGTNWVSEGRSAFTGTTTGTITSNDVANFSPFTLAAEDATNILPLKLITFNGKKENGNAHLNWQVATDGIPAYFELLTSEDNKNFRVLAKINSLDLKTNYEFTGKLANGLNYFRLKLVDFNGDQLLSRIVVISNKNNGFELVSALPTATSAKTSILITADKPQKVQLTLMNSEGKIVQNRPVSVGAGNNLITIDLSANAAGVYYLQGISEGGERSLIKLVRF
ncbi:MAG TPA: T9SS type A sorting domain-containing protein, partial [Chitinophagaceae bacterium]|nr:T9SS type A sorting domain-containing protein [Chitinophagaceae bacterium]